jgi:hypothetical protein
MEKIICTFDFDKTLNRPDVQEYARELIAKGIDVWVVTSRYDDLHTHNYQYLADYDDNFSADYNNDDLWIIVDDLQIPRHKVRFTNMEFKSAYLQKTNALWHLDDSFQELAYIKMDKIKTVGIQVNSGSWKQKCNRILNKKLKGNELRN